MGNNDDNVIGAEIVENLPAVPDRTHESRKAVKVEHPCPDGRDWPQGPTPERRCKAHSSRTGEPCKNAAIKGATVCRFHGGAAKHVKANARARLENAADRMAKQLLGIALTAESEAVMLAAVKDALDRAGLKAPSEVVLSQGGTKPYEEIFDSIATTTRAESRAARGLPESDSETSGYEVAGGAGHRFPLPHPGRPPGTGPAFASGDPASDQFGTPHEPPAPPPQGRPRASDREQHAQPPGRHIQGDDALEVAARLAREQRAIESKHKKYRRP